MATYKIGIGYAGIVLETHIVEAKNLADARHMAYRWATPDKGFDHIEVKRIKKEVK